MTHGPARLQPRGVHGPSRLGAAASSAGAAGARASSGRVRESKRLFGDPWASAYRIGPHPELLGDRVPAALPALGRGARRLAVNAGLPRRGGPAPSADRAHPRGRPDRGEPRPARARPCGGGERARPGGRAAASTCAAGRPEFFSLIVPERALRRGRQPARAARGGAGRRSRVAARGLGRPQGSTSFGSALGSRTIRRGILVRVDQEAGEALAVVAGDADPEVAVGQPGGVGRLLVADQLGVAARLDVGVDRARRLLAWRRSRPPPSGVPPGPRPARRTRSPPAGRCRSGRTAPRAAPWAGRPARPPAGASRRAAPARGRARRSAPGCRRWRGGSRESGRCPCGPAAAGAAGSRRAA